ncbi:MAG: hypothetical protein ACFFH0_01910 [Promethearchaeota archaeon]
MSKGLIVCTPTCKEFKCSRQPSVLKIRRTQSKKIVVCTEIDDECDGAWCKFGVCAIRKMTDAGKCRGLHTGPAFSDDYLDPVEDGSEEVPSIYSKHLGGVREFDRDGPP